MIEVTIPPTALIDESRMMAALRTCMEAVAAPFREDGGFLIHPDMRQKLQVNEDTPTRTLFGRPVEFAYDPLLGWLGPAVAIYGRPLLLAQHPDSIACLVVDGAPRTGLPARDDALRVQALESTHWATRGARQMAQSEPNSDSASQVRPTGTTRDAGLEWLVNEVTERTHIAERRGTQLFCDAIIETVPFRVTWVYGSGDRDDIVRARAIINNEATSNTGEVTRDWTFSAWLWREERHTAISSIVHEVVSVANAIQEGRG